MEEDISKVSKNGSALDVERCEGEKSNSNLMWVRDTAQQLTIKTQDIECLIYLNFQRK